jgi:transcriptional regulator with XRE-family HTH domain
MVVMPKILDQLKAAITASEKSRYRIAQETGIAESVLSRLMSGERGLSIETAETLAKYLGLEIVLRQDRRGKGR